MLRDDPYYIVDDRPKQQNIDVDSIPVVKLDDLPPLNSDTDNPSSKFNNRPMPSPQVSYTIDRGGEMPPGAVAKEKTPSPSPSHPATPARSGTPAMPAPPFQQYEYDDDVPRPATPPLIKVTRVKKKGTGPSKKKKLKEPSASQGDPATAEASTAQ